MGRKKTADAIASTVLYSGVPKGIRTPVTAVKGRCPRPLDDGDAKPFDLRQDTFVPKIKDRIAYSRSSIILVASPRGFEPLLLP